MFGKVGTKLKVMQVDPKIVRKVLVNIGPTEHPYRDVFSTEKRSKASSKT